MGIEQLSEETQAASRKLAESSAKTDELLDRSADLPSELRARIKEVCDDLINAQQNLLMQAHLDFDCAPDGE